MSVKNLEVQIPYAVFSKDNLKSNCQKFLNYNERCSVKLLVLCSYRIKTQLPKEIWFHIIYCVMCDRSLRVEKYFRTSVEFLNYWLNEPLQQIMNPLFMPINGLSYITTQSYYTTGNCTNAEQILDCRPKIDTRYGSIAGILDTKLRTSIEWCLNNKLYDRTIYGYAKTQNVLLTQDTYVDIPSSIGISIYPENFTDYMLFIVESNSRQVTHTLAPLINIAKISPFKGISSGCKYYGWQDNNGKKCIVDMTDKKLLICVLRPIHLIVQLHVLYHQNAEFSDYTSWTIQEGCL